MNIHSLVNSFVRLFIHSFSQYLHISKLMITHLVHETVQQGGGTARVYSELALRSEVVRLLQITIKIITALWAEGGAKVVYIPHPP